jgi:ABC-type transport system involved in multi-copper enzyme maturation permease subunit
MSSPGLSRSLPGWGNLLRISLLGLLLIAAGAGISLLPVDLLFKGILFGVLGIVGFQLLRPADFHLLGPHFFYDLIRLARRGRSTVVRIAYAFFLLFGLCLVYANQLNFDPLAVLFAPGPVLTPNSLAKFAEAFLHMLLVVQILTVFVVTPAYVAGAIAEEREAGTLDLLFTTHLSDREIVLGKLCARLVHMAGVLLVGLPVLALTQFLGGVDMELILAGFANTFLALLGVGSLSIFISAQAQSVLGAVMGTYGFMFLFAIVCLPFGGVFQLANTETIAAFTIGNLILAGTCLPLAIQCVRGDKPLRPVMPPLLPPKVIMQPGNPDPFLPRPPVSDRPILWKEMYPASLGETFILCLVGMLLLPLAAASFGGRESPSQVPLRVVIMVIGFLATLGVVYQTASCLIKERQQKTLESLLLLPISVWHILWEKFLGSILRRRFVFATLGGFLLLGVVAMVFHPFSVAWFCLAFLIQLIFLASMGLWVSAVSSTPLWATFTTSVLLLLIFGAPWWFLMVLRPAGWWTSMLEVGINPLGSWWFLLFTWKEGEAVDPRIISKLVAVLVGLAMYAALTGAFWLHTRTRLAPK